MSWGLSCQAHVGTQRIANAASIKDLVSGKATAQPLTGESKRYLTDTHNARTHTITCCPCANGRPALQRSTALREWPATPLCSRSCVLQATSG